MVYRAVVVLVLAFGLLLPASARAATAVTSGATAITDNSATLNGSVSTASSDSAYGFQYGTDPNAMIHNTGATPIGKVSSQPVTANLTNLQAGTTYYYRLIVVENASNSKPTTTAGDTLNFTTTGTAGTVATTGNATNVTSTSATLHGVANPSADDSGWAFQYGTSTNYGKLTVVQPIGTGVHAVTQTVTGLKPNTTYHFRLVVNQGTYPRSNALGADQTFTTKPSGGGGGGGKKNIGQASLRSHRLKVHKGRVAVPLKCSGPAGKQCKGKLSITSRGKINGKKKTVSCGKTKFSFKTGKKKTLHPRIGKGCATLLNTSSKHQIGATLKIVFSTGQKTLKTHVTLFLG
jgi:hypothetical protein